MVRYIIRSWLELAACAVVAAALHAASVLVGAIFRRRRAW